VTEPEGRQQNLLAIFRRLMGYCRPYRRKLISTTLLAMVAQGAALTIPALTGHVIDDALKPQDHHALYVLVLLIVVAGVVRFGLMILRRLYAGQISLDVEYDLRMAMYAHLQRLSYGFYDRNQTGQLLSRATSDIQVVRFFLGYGLIFLTQHITTVIAVSVLLVWTSPPLALLSFFMAPLIIWVAARYSRRSHPILRDAQQKVADVTTHAEENIVGVRVVKSFAQEDAETARFRARSEAVFDRQLAATRLMALFRPVLEFVPTLGMGMVLLVGGILVIDGRLSAGGFFQFNLYLAMLIAPLRMLGMWIGQVQRAIASGERIFQVLDVEPEIVDVPAPTPLPDGAGALRFEDVTFGYDPARPVLRGLDLDVEAGQTIALGRSRT